MKTSSTAGIAILTYGLMVLTEACKKVDSSNNPVLPLSLTGKFTYSGYFTDSTLVITGVMEITRADSLISGSCTLQRIDDTSLVNNCALEWGSHILEGTISKEGAFTIFLTPEKFGLVYIQGTLTAGAMEGPRYLDSVGSLVPFLLGYFVLQRQ